MMDFGCNHQAGYRPPARIPSLVTCHSLTTEITEVAEGLDVRCWSD